MKTFKMKSLHVAVLSGLAALGLSAQANIHSQRTYDNALLLRAAATVVATDTGTLIVDLGTGKIVFDTIIDITNMKVSTGDEVYTVEVQGSPDANFGTPANITTLVLLRLGSATGASVGTADPTLGRVLMRGDNERFGSTYRYIRFKVTIAGTTPTLSYLAFAAKTE